MRVKIESNFEVRKGAYRSLYEKPANEVYAKQDTWYGIRVSKWLLGECDEHTAVFETRQRGLEVIDLLRKSIGERIRNGEIVKVVVYKTISGKEREIVLADVPSKCVARLNVLYEILETKWQEKEDFEFPHDESEEAKIKRLMRAMRIVANNLKLLLDNGYSDPAFTAAQESAVAKFNEWLAQRKEIRVRLQEPIDAAKAEMAELGINMESAHWLLNRFQNRQ